MLSLMDKVGGPRRATILILGLSCAFGVFSIAKWASEPAWVAAFADVPIGDVGPLTDRLTQAGVEYKLGGSGGTVLVRSSDVPKARVTLARAGVLPSGDRPGFELFDQPSWGQTDLTQRVNYRRALEGELERTISGMRGIKRAKVLLVIPESENYGVAAQPAEASIVLESQGSEGIAADVVKGIARTVAASVEGLTSDHVTIVDDAGRALSEGDEPSSGTGLSSRQLSIQLEYEQHLREKTERLLLPILGAGNARVQVNATLGFDRVERMSQTVDPDRQAVATEQKAEVVPGDAGGAGSVNTAASYVNSTTTESISSAIGTVKRLSVAVLLATPTAGGASAASDASAGTGATTVDSTALRFQVETMVKSAVGFDAARGDVVTVSMLPFMPIPVRAQAAPPTTIETLQVVQRPALIALGTVLAFIIALLTLKAAGKTTESITPLSTGTSGFLPSGAHSADAGQSGAHYGHGPQAVGGSNAAGSLPGRSAPLIVIPNNPMRDQVLASVQQQPDVSAKLMRAWLMES